MMSDVFEVMELLNNIKSGMEAIFTPDIHKDNIDKYWKEIERIAAKNEVE